ncbi:MAG: HAD family hydrolase [Verrucomicrobia bacterium]|nr:HAD family hydrolase [Verrucomicrobiota bacterium]
MRIRAVIFDIYGTLLEVAPPPADAEARWNGLWREHFSAEPRLSLAEFAAACEQVVARDHAAARAAGIEFPEIYWPDVVAETVSGLASLSGPQRDEFMFRHAQLLHTVRFAAGAAGTLRQLARDGCLLGLASNCQPYTVRELDLALASAGLARDIFTPALCFRSFEHGFSKPDPHVFRLLTVRLRTLGISPAETLMVGDRLENDIEPARAQGWQTWRSASVTDAGRVGNWQALREWLQPPLATK